MEEKEDVSVKYPPGQSSKYRSIMISDTSLRSISTYVAISE